MAQDLAPKRLDIAANTANQAGLLLGAADQLEANAGILAQTGGNFEDTDFANSSLVYLTAYQANVFLQSVVPAFTAFLDSHLENNPALPTHREYLEILVTGPV